LFADSTRKCNSPSGEERQAALASLPRLPTSPHKPSRTPCLQHCSLMPSPPLTYDNGKEFAYHQTLAEGLDAQGYFAHPYHSWERGLNENTNGLIRQYLPKGTDFRTLTLGSSTALWTDSTTGHGNVSASRLQISSSQESTHLLHLRVESAVPCLGNRCFGGSAARCRADEAERICLFTRFSYPRGSLACRSSASRACMGCRGTKPAKRLVCERQE